MILARLVGQTCWEPWVPQAREEGWRAGELIGKKRVFTSLLVPAIPKFTCVKKILKYM